MFTISMRMTPDGLIVWTVFDKPPSNRAAQFPSTVYGTRRAKFIAEQFLQELRKGARWEQEYDILPVE